MRQLHPWKILGDIEPQSHAVAPDWEFTIRDYVSHPKFRDAVRKSRLTIGLHPFLWGISHYQAADMIMPMVFDLVKDAVEDLCGSKAVSQLADVIPVLTAMDSGSATTSNPHGQMLLTVSGNFINLCRLMLSVQSVVGAPDSETSHFTETLAVLRFYALQQSLFGLSATHELKRRRPIDIPPGAIEFVVAHEVSHIVLGHNPLTASSKEELEADELAARILLNLTQSRSYNVRVGALAVLSAIEFLDGCGIIIPTKSHPDYSSRQDVICPILNIPLHEADIWRRVVSLNSVASDLTTYVPEEVWRQLHLSRLWDTQVRKPSVYSEALVYDQLVVASEQQLIALLENMDVRYGVDIAENRTAVSMAQDWLETGDLSIILVNLGFDVVDGQVEGLRLYDLVEAIKDLRFWDEDAIISILLALLLRTMIFDSRETLGEQHA